MRRQKKEIGGLYPLARSIECLYDQLVMERDREKARANLLKTGRTFMLEGWVPVPRIDAVEELIKKYECCSAYEEPDEDENVPVLTENGSLSEPFEAITDMYSSRLIGVLTRRRCFRFFYAMFFGIMLSDAGYGIVIAAACFIVLKKYDLEGMTRRMIKMFFYCGLSTVFWGSIVRRLVRRFSYRWRPELCSIKEITVPALWFNPIDDPTRLLIWSLVFGVIHLFLGMGIKAYMLIKRGHFWDAVFDVFSWYMVIAGAAMWLAGGAVSEALVKPGMYIAIAGALILPSYRRKKQ